MKGFFSPIDKLAAELPRTKGTGAEFMTELSKRPGYRPQEAQDRDLQALMAMPKMAREEFLAQLKAKPAPKLQETVLDNASAPTKFDQYTLPGGENYREILMRMPHDEQRAKEFADPASGHWDVPNVLAHVRAKDRVGPNGEKLLHIEEIQSDWHQKGREHGYATPESLKEFRALELRHKLLKQKLDEAKAQSESAENSLKRKEPLFQQPDVRERYEAARVRANNDIMDLMPQVMKAQAEVQDFGHKMDRMVPNAPFKKNWHELALKKMIHHAAEQGYHGIVITPGEEQANRYDLSKHIGMVAYHPEQQRFQAFKPNRETVINEAGATPERVAELIGKDAAERLMKAPKAGDHHYLEGEDLRVGGEGMKGFYDKIVPSFLNQFGKKYGAKVGTMPIETKAPSIEKAGASFYQVPGKQAVVHHFPITPEMREDVTKNGVPLYAKGGSIKPKAARDANLAQFLKDSAVKDRLYHSTNSNISSFKTNMPSSNNYGFLGDAPVTRSAIFLTPNYKFSQEYLREGHGQNVMPVHASIKKPFDLRHGLTEKQEAELEAAGVNTRYVHNTTPWELFDNDENNQNYLVDTLKKLGYDSAVFHEHSPSGTGQAQTTYAAFHPHQIKSAIGNRGTYDPNNPDITKAQGGLVHMSKGGSGHAFVKHKHGEKVGGYHVGEKINNYGSYESSGINKVLPGIHKVPMSSFETTHPNDLFYAKNDHDRVRHLAEQIKHNQYLDPLLVAMDEKGPYVLEGGHRLGAAHLLGMKEIPAMIGYEPEVEHLAPKAQGGSIKPVGYTKEKVTVSPNLDQMQYELISVKHSKKVK